MKKSGLFSMVMLFSAYALAATEEATTAAATTMANMAGWTGMGGWIAAATGLAIAIAVFGGAAGQGRAAAAALEGIARNPQASDKLFTPLILSLALIESLVILAGVIAFLLIAKLPDLTKLLGN